jgi:hypothetical protein
MATLTEKPTGKHDAFINGQLDRTRQRIRLLDLLAGGFGFLAGTLAFVAVMILLDFAFKLADGTRQVFALFYLIAAGFYVWFAIVRPLRREINPHYAARKLEETAGPGRHHVVNWIDLHDERMPAAFRAGLDRRAAKDLQAADPERAISNRLTVGSAVAAGVMAVIVIALFIALGPGPFGAFFGRAFGRSVDVPARTQIEIVKPEGGDGVVTIGSPALIAVRLTGLQPRDGATLHLRHDPSEPMRPRPMTKDGEGEWSATVGPLEVGNGFWYQVTAGDGKTAEHRISVRATPALTGFLATYRYRPYVNKADRTRTARRLEDLRGTEVILTAKTNRELRECSLDFVGEDGKRETLRGEVTPQGPRFRLVLDRPGKYQLSYTATTGETYTDATANDVLVINDNAPTVKFTAPAKNVEIPINGQVSLAAEAADDIGLAGVTLKLKVKDGAELPDMPYLADKLGTAEFGAPRELSYREVLTPSALKAELKPGMVIEYYLEARDGCDYKAPNVGRSEKFAITLKAPGDADAQKKKRDEEKKKKEEHDKKQADGLKKEKQKRDDDKKKEEGQEKADAQAREQGGVGTQPSEEPKDGDAQKDKETQDKADQLRETLNKGGGDKGEAKPGAGKGAEEKGPPGEGKPADDAKEEKPGAAKDGEGDKPGESKGGEKAEKSGEGKDEGKDAKDQKPGEKKDGDPGKGDKPGKGKSGEQKPGEGKGAGGDRPPNEAGEAKDGEPMAGDKTPGEGKDGKPNDAARPDEKAGEGKPGQEGKPEDKGSGKPAGPPPEGATSGKPSDGAPPPDGKPGEGKDGQPGEGAGKGGPMPGEGMGMSKGGDGPPAGDGGKDGSPDGGMGGESKPGGMGGMAGGENKPGQFKDAGGGGGPGSDESPPPRRERPVGSRATMLQLEEFRESVGDDVLKDAKMSREQFEKFLKDYAALAGRMKKEEEERDNVRPGAPGSLPTASGIGPKPTPGPADAARGAGRPKPPPEYRDSFADFLRRLR